MKYLFLILIISFSSLAQSPSTQLGSMAFPEADKIRSGDTGIFTFNRFMMVDRISIEIKKGLFCQNGTLRFSYDGLMESYISYNDSGATGYRTYIIEVGAQVQSIEITNNMRCAIRVKNLKVLSRRGYLPRGVVWNNTNLHLYASEILGSVMFLADTLYYLEPFMNDLDMVNFISPLRGIIGRTMAILESHPDTSSRVRIALEELLLFLQKNRSYIDKLLSIEALSINAQDIISVQEILQNAIR